MQYARKTSVAETTLPFLVLQLPIGTSLSPTHHTRNVIYLFSPPYSLELRHTDEDLRGTL